MNTRKLRSPYFWEEAPFLRPVLALVAGILAYKYIPAPSFWQYALLVTAPLLLLTIALTGLRRNPGRLAASLQAALIPLFFLSLGLLACAARDPRMLPGFSDSPPAGPTT